MRISEMMITLFVIAIFSTGFVGFYAGMLNANSLTAQNFTYLNNTSTTTSSLQNIYITLNSSQGRDSGLSQGLVAFAPINLLIGAFNAVMSLFNLPIIFYSMIVDLTSSVTGFPLWVANDLTMIFLIMFVSAIIYLIIGRAF